eukprot:Rhum_TRINITY_DN15139_c1_g1::Rhum_TRINITY_DN15139_c1_g1_i1::g.140060::m.140060
MSHGVSEGTVCDAGPDTEHFLPKHKRAASFGEDTTAKRVRLLPPCAALPAVYVISRSRCWKTNGTLALLCADRIEATVVVEPGETQQYSEWLQGSGVRVHTLPANDMGVSYARNAVLDLMRSTAPSPDGERWFWILDDDVSAFKRIEDGVVRTVPARTALTEGLRVAEVVSDSRVAMVSLEYGTFSYGLRQYNVGDIIRDSYCNVCSCYCLERLPEGLRFRFRVREDYDIVLQVIAAGLSTVRLKWLSFDAPSMGSSKGGMHDYYANEAVLQAETTRFLQTWNRVAQAKTTAQRAIDVRVLWSQLRTLMPLQKLDHQRSRDATVPNT